MPKMLVTHKVIQNLLSGRYGQDNDKPPRILSPCSTWSTFQVLLSFLQRIEAGNLEDILVVANAKLVAQGAQSSAHSRRKYINPRLKDWEMAKGNVHSLH